MWLKSPKFWQKPFSLPTVLLAPASRLYEMAHRWRYNSIAPKNLSVPVICVGNATIGGSGKTPVALLIAAYLLEQGKHPVFLSRGYGGNLTEPTLVDLHMHTSSDVGDEPLLLAKTAPTWIAQDRVEGAKAAIAQGAEIIIMDDGFQNPSLHKDISLLVVDGSYGFGNGKLLPAGPLRERLDNAFSRSNAVILIGNDTHNIAASLPDDLPLVNASITPHHSAASWKDTSVIAFAGIGNPQKFFDTLQSIGAKIHVTYDFPDHYPYKKANLETLLEDAKRYNARLITTEKDWVRLPKAYQDKIFHLPITLQWKDFTVLENLLKEI